MMDMVNPKIFEGMFKVWERQKFNLYFYFEEIFDKVLQNLKARNKAAGLCLYENGISHYRSLFMPVGFSLENLAVFAAIFRPDRVTFVSSETTRFAHRDSFYLIEESIRKCCPEITIDNSLTVTSDDHGSMEQKVILWAEKMHSAFGIGNDQMAIDLTGGTKPMSIGAQNAAISLGIQAFYLSVQYDEIRKKPLPGTERLVQFELHQSKTEKNKAFVIMPFSQKMDWVYETIEQAVNSNGMQCLRADKGIFEGPIFDRVLESINHSGLIIAELTEKNPNVFYELGFSHAWNKHVIMLTQKIGTMPFDIKHLRMVVYEENNRKDLKNLLEKEIGYYLTKGQLGTSAERNDKGE